MLRSSLRSEHRPASAHSRTRRISPADGTAEREANSATRRVLNGDPGACVCGGGCPRCETASSPAGGQGRPLEPATRAFFEPRFGQDLGGVRIHDDAMADRSARALGAKAYTVGNDVAFARGRYAPDRPAGQELLAHELSHVVLHAREAPGTIFRSEDEATPSKAEIERLYAEMMNLAADNTWIGVNRNYEKIEEMGPDPFAVARNPVNLHFLGAEAARNMGNMLGQRSRLRRALTALGSAEGEEAAAQRTTIEESLGNIESTFGMVYVKPRTAAKTEKKATKRGGPALVRPEMPFLPDLQRSIEAASETLAEKGEFTGMLPAGEYLLDGMSVTVVAGTDNSFLWGD